MKSLLAGFALVCALVLTGCVTGLRPGGVTVNVVNLLPVNATVLETQAALTLRYSNENPTALGLTGGTHKLYLNGSYVGKAVSNQSLDLPALSTATQDVTINLENLALVRPLMAIRDRQAADYRIESVLYFTNGSSRTEIKAESKGSLDLQALAQSVR